MASSCTDRSGLTLVELLTVVAIIGILVVLMLPAIVSVRRAAQRVQCQNQLKQLGVALNAHESGHRRFPPGSLEDWSWIARILPQLEEKSLYDDIDFSQDPLNPPNDVYSGRILPVLLCPSDELSATVHTAQLDYGSQLFAHTNYLGTLSAGPSRGMFGRDQGVRIRDVTDGTAKTILVGERAVVSDSGHTHGWWVWGVTTDTYLSANAGLKPGNNQEHSSAYRFWSHHSAGANFVFVDGSVHLLTFDIEPQVFRALCTRDGYERVALDE